jgi:transcriptional regulator with GAF, ATPase, and Fis domain
LVEAFVVIADSLGDSFDLVDTLQRVVEYSVELLQVDAAGIMIADQRGGLQVLAASSEQIRLLELFQLQAGDGPCLECFSSQDSVLVPAIADSAGRWPLFAAEAARQGFQSVHAIPLRLREDTIGTLSLFQNEDGPLPDDDLRVARAMAEVVTIGILNERAIHRGEMLSEHLQTALNSRVVIEQAKGILAERGASDMDVAFARLRGYSRDHNLRLSEVARAVIDGTVDVAQVLGSIH